MDNTGLGHGKVEATSEAKAEAQTKEEKEKAEQRSRPGQLDLSGWKGNGRIENTVVLDFDGDGNADCLVTRRTGDEKQFEHAILFGTTVNGHTEFGKPLVLPVVTNDHVAVFVLQQPAQHRPCVLALHGDIAVGGEVKHETARGLLPAHVLLTNMEMSKDGGRLECRRDVVPDSWAAAPHPVHFMPVTTRCVAQLAVVTYVDGNKMGRAPSPWTEDAGPPASAGGAERDVSVQGAVCDGAA